MLSVKDSLGNKNESGCRVVVPRPGLLDLYGPAKVKMGILEISVFFKII